jgi:cell wall-associated NlpC family hydrolase
MGQRQMKRKIIITATILLVGLLGGTDNSHGKAVQLSNKAQIDIVKQLKLSTARQQLPKQVVKLTKQVNRTPYVFSGSSKQGWDCSGLVRYLYKQVGVVLPHSADKQAHKGIRVSQPKRGDIVAFAYKGSTNFYHVAIYLNDGLIIHANQSSGTTVIEPLSAYKTSQIRFIRIL